MRLLNVHTLELELFQGGPKTTYAILSHTWGAEEVTFDDLMSGRGPEMKAWSKITSCCAKAREEGYLYVWIDTCCIDKSSSAELTEAINSMFKWYQDAEVCYAYLADFSMKPLQPYRKADLGFNDSIAYDLALLEELEESIWFTRGWTLQELLAPPDVLFLSGTWEEIGTRDSLAKKLWGITKIDLKALTKTESLSSYSVAQRMSWAAGRQTTRIEDEAYCLMGLFGVSMPLLYGEGEKAFKRLQLEIMKECYDPSILAWSAVDSYATLVGVLATSPAAFEGCGLIEFTGSGSAPRGSAEDEVFGCSHSSHDVVGSSLRMKAPAISLKGYEAKLRLTSKAKSINATSDCDSADDFFQRLFHFPKEGNSIMDSGFFEFSFLSHREYFLILVLLRGCKRYGHTVGITLCKDSSGLLRRVHYPTRFLVSRACTRYLGSAGMESIHSFSTLHMSLSGSEVLQRPLVPDWIRCLVRPRGLTDTGYSFSHTIPPMATDSENCWYLNRWSQALDVGDMALQPCFSLRGVQVGRAIVFKNCSEPHLSIRLIYYLRPQLSRKFPTGKPEDFSVTIEVGEQVLEEAEEVEKPGEGELPWTLTSQTYHFNIQNRFKVLVKFRSSARRYVLAIVQFSEI